MGVLSDLVPPEEIVDVFGKPIKVRGLTVYEIAEAMTVYPELGNLIDRQDVDIAALTKEMPAACAAFIAAGVGAPGDAIEIEAAKNLPIEVQLDLLEGIVKRTFRRGIGPFAARLMGLLGQGLVREPARATTSPSKSPILPRSEDSVVKKSLI